MYFIRKICNETQPTLSHGYVHFTHNIGMGVTGSLGGLWGSIRATDVPLFPDTQIE